MKLSKKYKILISTTATLVSVGTFATVATQHSNTETSNLLKESSTATNAASNSKATTGGVIATPTSYEANAGLQTISNNYGPILVTNSGKTFGNYDWYGNENWSITLSNDASGTYPNSGTKVIDWDYLDDKRYLYVLTDTQYMFCVDTNDGTVIANSPRTTSNIPTGTNRIAHIKTNDMLYVWNSNTAGTQQVYSVNRATLEAKKITGNALTSDYLVDVLSLDNNAGFNIAVSSTSAVSGPDAQVSSLKLSFIDNNMNVFTPSTGNGTMQETTVTFTSTKLSDLYIKAYYHDLSGQYIVFIGDQIYKVSLVTNAMEKSTFTKMTSNNITVNSINSAFKDGNKEIFFSGVDASDSNKKKIFSINADGNGFAQYYSLDSMSYMSTDVADTNTKIQIFPVKDANNNLLSGQIFVASAKMNLGGISNKSASGNNLFNSTAIKPTFANSSDLSSSIPSAVTFRNFTLYNTSTSLSANTMTFEADDRTGELNVTARLEKKAWYSSNSNATSISVVHASYKLKTASQATTWATQTQFDAIGGGYFKKLSPNQISSEDFDKYADQVLKIDSKLVNAANNLKRTFTLTDTTKDSQVTVMATVEYYDNYGNYITYDVSTMTYNIKANSSAQFAFQGQTTYVANDSKDVTTISALSAYKNYLPSLISESDLPNFISVQDGYPTSSVRRIINAQPNDQSGTLVINVVYVGISNTTKNDFTITYSGFPSTGTSIVKWQGDSLDDVIKEGTTTVDGVTTYTEKAQKAQEIKEAYNANGGVDGGKLIDITTISSYSNYGTLLSTDIQTTQVNLVYTSLLSNMGYQPTLTIQRTDLDNEYGVITITLDYRNSTGNTGVKLNTRLLQELGIVTGNDVGVISQKFSGFLPIGSTYGVTLKDASDEAVQSVVANNNVNSIIDNNELLNTLSIKGYDTDGSVNIQSYTWDGEKLVFTARAQSAKYETVNGIYNFTIDWAPKFASIRERNLIVATLVSIVGVAIVAGAISAYVLRKNKIRRLLK